MSDVATIISDLGGYQAVAKVLNVGSSTVSEMRRRGSIPVKWWPALIQSERGKEIGLNAYVLMVANAKMDREPAEASR